MKDLIIEICGNCTVHKSEHDDTVAMYPYCLWCHSGRPSAISQNHDASLRSSIAGNFFIYRASPRLALTSHWRSSFTRTRASRLSWSRMGISAPAEPLLMLPPFTKRPEEKPKQ